MSQAHAQAASPGAPKDEAEFQDCLPCRVMGGGTFIGLGIFSYISGHSQLRKEEAAILRSGSIFGMRSRRAAITSLAISFVGAGVYRLVR